MISLRARDIGDGASLSVNMGARGSEILRAYLEAREAWLDEYFMESNFLFPSRITDDGIMPSEAIKGVEEKIRKECGIRIDLESLRETFGRQ